MRNLSAASVLVWMLMGGSATAHFGQPLVKEVRFPVSRGGEAWLVIDNVGLLARAPGQTGWRWLCDEAMTPVPGLDSVAPIDAEGRRWLAGARSGLFITADDGCAFTRPVDDPFAEHVVPLVSPAPGSANEAIVGTQTLGRPNDVFRTTDGGLTWSAAGLALDGRVRTLVRATADPRVVYVGHTHGALRSDDGGLTFTPVALGPPELAIEGESFRFLGTHPADARDVFAAIDAFPDSTVLRSTDGGLTWAEVTRLGDVPETLAFLPDGRGAILSTPFDGLHRSRDGGATWARVPSPATAVLGCLTVEPATGRLWACARGVSADWRVGSSGDEGETWLSELGGFGEITARWACPAESPTAMACAQACDRSADASCGQVPADAGASAPDAAAPSGARDAAVDHDAIATPEADRGASRSGGCTVPLEGAPAPWLLLIGAIGGWVRRRSRS